MWLWFCWRIKNDWSLTSRLSYLPERGSNRNLFTDTVTSCQHLCASSSINWYCSLKAIKLQFLIGLSEFVCPPQATRLEGVFSITCHWQLKCYCRLIIDYNRSVLIEISNIFIYIYIYNTKSALFCSLRKLYFCYAWAFVRPSHYRLGLVAPSICSISIAGMIEVDDFGSFDRKSYSK